MTSSQLIISATTWVQIRSHSKIWVLGIPHKNFGENAIQHITLALSLRKAFLCFSFKNNFYYLFIFGCAGSQLLAGFSLVSVLQLLTSVAFLVQSTGSRAQAQSVVVTHQLSCSERWGIKLESPALAGGFLCTGPPGKSLSLSLSSWNLLVSSLFP